MSPNPTITTRRRDTLIGQILALNVLLVCATLFGASLAAGLDLTVSDQRRQFLVLAWAVILSLLLNMLVLRHRFRPLERLIDQLEAIDPARPEPLAAPTRPAAAEVERLSAAFRRLLERIEGERRRSGRLVLRAQEEERKRVARDLHDEVNQALTAVLLRLEAACQDAPPGLAAELGQVKALTTRAMEELLGLARQLRPTALDDHGLLPALDGQVRRFATQTGIAARLSSRGDPSLVGDEQRLVVYRVAQEALTNAARHADARTVMVELEASGTGVELRVRDDGRGFDPAAAAAGEGLGLGGMAERARLAGGTLAVEAAPGRGTTIALSIA